jgi:hypothetical protein
MASEEATGRRLTVTIGRGFWRNLFKWAAGILLMLSLLALLVALGLAQLTAEGPAKRTLQRSVASLTEIDTLLDEGYDELRQEAEEDDEASLGLKDFPVQVSLSAEEVLDLSQSELRGLLLDRSADRLYDEGMSAFREEGTDLGEEGMGFFSTQGAVWNSLGFLRDNVHDGLRVAVASLAGVCLVLTAALALLARGFGRLASVGAAVCAAAVPFLAGAVAVRFALRLASEGNDEYLVRELLRIGEEIAWIPIRDSIAFTAMGVAFLLAGIGLALWADRRPATR